MIKDKINDDYKRAFKEKREGELSVLKMLKAAVLNKEKDKEFAANKAGEDVAAAIMLSDEEILDVVSSEIKKLRDSLALFEKGGRNDLADRAKSEIEILLRYLPEQLGEDEIKKLVAGAIAQTGAVTVKDMGKVMGILMPKVKGKADTGLVSKLAKEALS
jgi:hypothetical protein